MKRASLSRLTPTVLALLLRRFVRFTSFFLPPPYVSTHCPPPSLQWVSFSPHPTSPPQSNPSVIGAASWPQCLWALPSSAHQTAALPASLPACPALNLLTMASLRGCPAAVTAPLSGRGITTAATHATAHTDGRTNRLHGVFQQVQTLQKWKEDPAYSFKVKL